VRIVAVAVWAGCLAAAKEGFEFKGFACSRWSRSGLPQRGAENMVNGKLFFAGFF
jgi:hypothetical protein